jgi:hypothetical protein
MPSRLALKLNKTHSTWKFGRELKRGHDPGKQGYILEPRLGM